MGRLSRHKIPAKHTSQPLEDNLGHQVPETEDTPTQGSHCQYPIGNPKEPDFHFCGQPKKVESYCQEHWNLTHNTQHQKLGWK